MYRTEKNAVPNPAVIFYEVEEEKERGGEREWNRQ